jgi:hypothetical protein
MDTTIITIIITLLSALGLLLFTQKERLREFTFGFTDRGITWTIKLDKSREELKNAGVDIQRSAEELAVDNNPNNVSERDAVIHSWASLTQTVKSLASAKNVFIAENTDLPTIVDMLVSAGILPVLLAGPLRILYELGEEVCDKPKAKIDSASSFEYQYFVNALIKAVSELLKPPIISDSNQISTNQPRKTQVGGGSVFPHPEQGRSTAVLHCLAGSLQGQHFSINKPIYRIGATANNDLVIPNDDYISGSHAHVNYDQGSLLLYDDGSRNGTFLNGNRLDKSFRLLKPGDKIQLGACTFEVT